MSGADTKKKLVGRHKRVAFMDVASDGKTYTRMTGFTSMSESKNASAGHDGGYQAAQRPAPASAIGDGFMNIPDGVEDEGLPFN